MCSNSCNQKSNGKIEQCVDFPSPNESVQKETSSSHLKPTTSWTRLLDIEKQHVMRRERERADTDFELCFRLCVAAPASLFAGFVIRCASGVRLLFGAYPQHMCSRRYFGVAHNLIRRIISPNWVSRNWVSCQTQSLWLENGGQCRRHTGRSSIAVAAWTHGGTYLIYGFLASNNF